MKQRSFLLVIVCFDGGLAGDLNVNQETEWNSVEVPSMLQQDKLDRDEEQSLRIIKSVTSEDIDDIGLVNGLKADTIDNVGEEVEQNLCQSLHPTDVSGGINQSTGKERKRKPSGKCSLPSCTETDRHRCSRCLSVSYCSQLCNDQNWSEHREQCKDFRERDREAGVD